MKKKKKLLTFIRHSCLTGKAVWVYRGPSKDAARMAYKRAFHHEEHSVRMAGTNAARRKRNILRMLKHLLRGSVSSCSSSSSSSSSSGDPLDAFPPDKRTAAQQIVRIADEAPKPDRDFYAHVQEERRQKENKLPKTKKK